MNTVKLTGSNYLRQRVILATLSGKNLKITKIRENEENPGLMEEEMNLLRMVESFTNGTTIKVNETGTVLFFSPGMLSGGTIIHECHSARCVTYYLEVILALGPFCADPLHVTLNNCITNSSTDVSVDAYILSVVPVLRQCGINDREDVKFEIKVNKRGPAPLGGGRINVSMPNPRKLRPVIAMEKGKIRRIRGTAYSTKVSPQTPGRMVEAARGILNQFLPDIFIFADVAKGAACGKSPGFGCCLVAESTESEVRISAEVMSNVKDERPVSAEEIGQEAALRLLEELNTCGVCDTITQPLLLLFATLNQGDVSKVLIGQLSQYSIEMLRNLKLFMGITFRMEVVEETPGDAKSQRIMMTCIGVGFQNVNKLTL